MRAPLPRTDELSTYLEELQAGQLSPFSAWPDLRVPKVAAGVYTIWRGDEFIYVGMAGRGMNEAKLLAYSMNGKRRGLADRLNSRASGRRSGDQFCVYVADHLVLPGLTTEEFQLVCHGKLSLDMKVREFIRRWLSFRFVVTRDGDEAAELERAVQRGALAAGKPFLNPL